jgi:hypothetical protein
MIQQFLTARIALSLVEVVDGYGAILASYMRNE